MNASERHHLPRLVPEYYKGFAAVHWTMPIVERRSGWLSESFHAHLREVLLHALARYDCCCPIYCLMPDHMHFMFVGWSANADQLLLIRFLRKHLNDLLKEYDLDCEFQKQAHDHVMRRDEMDESEFESSVLYIANNPVKAELVRETKDYPYTRVMLPGFPRIDFWSAGYWRIFWDQTMKRMSATQAAWNTPP